MTDDQIKHMVDRFLAWKLPATFNPDCGIKFDADAAKKIDPRNHRYEPSGTNLFGADEATAMVRHMLEGLPSSPVAPDLKLGIKREWCIDAARREGDAEVGAGPIARDPSPVAWPTREERAKAVYDLDPIYEGGECVDGFQVTPGGYLTWQQALDRDAEFGDDPVHISMTAGAFKIADAIEALYKKAMGIGEEKNRHKEPTNPTADNCD